MSPSSKSSGARHRLRRASCCPRTTCSLHYSPGCCKRLVTSARVVTHLQHCTAWWHVLPVTSAIDAFRAVRDALRVSNASGDRATEQQAEPPRAQLRIAGNYRDSAGTFHTLGAEWLRIVRGDSLGLECTCTSTSTNEIKGDVILFDRIGDELVLFDRTIDRFG